ncbi:nucleotidyltransferase family protein [Pseudoalteromonas prydzensis]|uniref:nucleotidyltransferase family protein n=1 Tax=Pseudoalteromonas prydzensis TaxID=182141 RepID=UPI003704A72E
MSHNWKNILVSPKHNIQQVLKVIDDEALQLALVVDDSGRLLGTVTDGDIRRALLNSLPLTTSISEIMFKKPTVGLRDFSQEKILELMKTKQLNAIPILENGKVVGLETLNSFSQKAKYDNPIFLMAGGFGTRLKPLTDNCPKPLLKVGDKPILETLLLQFIKSGFHNFYISTHYLPEMIREHFGDGKKWNVNIIYVHEDAPLGTGGALGLLPAGVPELPLILINGDVLTNLDFSKLLTFHNKQNADATMCVREYDYQIPYGVVEHEGTLVKGMVEKPTYHFFVNAGIYVIDPKIYKAVTNNKIIDMPTLLEQQMGKNKKVLSFPLHGYWLDIGRMDDFEKAQQDIVNLDLL